MTVQAKTNLSIFSFFILILTIIAFGVYPALRDIKKNSQDLIAEKNNLIFLDEEAENFNSLKESYEFFVPGLNALDKFFVNSELPVEFIGFLEKAAGENSLVIKISPVSLGKSQKNDWPFIAFRADLTGKFPGVLRFFRKLENAPYLNEIQNISVASQKDGSVNAEAVIKVFVK